MRTAHGGKFGVDLIDAAELFANACSLGPVNVRGLHLHIGSQITSVEPYVRAVEKALDLVEKLEAACGGPLEFLDIGGGYPVPYVDAADACDAADYFCATTTPHDYAEVICALVNERRPDLDPVHRARAATWSPTPPSSSAGSRARRRSACSTPRTTPSARSTGC